MTAGVAAGAAAGLAALPVSGPWQPASVILGWTAAILAVFSLVTGYTGWMGLACVLFVVRTAMHGLAGAGPADLVGSTVLLLVLVETGAASFEARHIPIHWPADMARTLLVAAGGAGIVMVAAGLVGGAFLAGPAALTGGLAAALVVGMLAVWIQRRASAGP